MNLICQIPKLNEFTIDYSSKKVPMQINELKSQIDASILFFNTMYIDISNTDMRSDIFNKKYNGMYKSIINDVYEHIEKINIMLEILQISDYSQTNKLKYKEVLNDFTDPGQLLNIFNELSIILFDKNINACLDKIEIKYKYKWFNLFHFNRKNKLEELDDIYNKKNTFMLNERINVFNHYINLITLQLCKMKISLKDTHSS